MKVTVICPQNEPARRLGDLRRRRAWRRREPAADDARPAARDRHRGRRRDDGPGPLRGDDGRHPPRSAPTRSIISTHPETRSGWMRKDLVSRIEEDSGLPVEHVVVDLDAEREDAVRTLVVANQTVESEPLHERIVEKNREGTHLFTVVVPASGGSGDPNERLAHLLKRLADEGIQAVGQVSHPDPFTAIQNAMQFYAVDDILISTLRGRALGMAAREPGRAGQGRHVEARRAHRRQPRARWRADGVGLSRRRARPRRAPRPAAREPVVADRAPDARDAAFHHLRGHALRSVLHGLLLHPGRGGRPVAGARASTPGRDRGRQHGDPALVVA